MVDKANHFITWCSQVWSHASYARSVGSVGLERYIACHKSNTTTLKSWHVYTRPSHRSVSLCYILRHISILMWERLPIVRPKPGERAPPIKTQARSATILPNFVGLRFQIHNGKIYNEITVTEDMVGHKLGEFSMLVRKFSFPSKEMRSLLEAHQHVVALVLTCCRTRKKFTYRLSKNR